MQIRIIEGKQETKKKIRVCAYCRVSTDADEQENSLENQISHYEDEIRSNPEYEYAGVYSDFAISGFKEKRPGFQKMLADARAGKIDLILTKSVSRFARNTNIVLSAVRELKELNVGVFFELQNINTLSGEGELMLTIIAAFAQAESESGSANAKMVYRRKYEKGIPVQYLDKSFGYTKDERGCFIPDENEAPWVKKMYEMVAEGYTVAAVRRFLNDEGIRTVKGAKWIDSAVFRVIENEIYKGDYIMQKNYVNEERKLVRNRGEVTSWYIEDDHEPVVSKELWQKAQDMLERKRDYLDTGSFVAEINDENYPYRKQLFCYKCGHPLYARIYSHGNRLNWGCSGQKRCGSRFCSGVNVPDGVIREWNFQGNIYLKDAGIDTHIGSRYSFTKESSWKRRNKKKPIQLDVPELNDENYPYRKLIYCAKCGSRLVRHIDLKSQKVIWICNGQKRKGSTFCKGTRVPDEEVRAFGEIKNDIYIERKENRYGKKCYSYTSNKPESKDKGKES